MPQASTPTPPPKEINAVVNPNMGFAIFFVLVENSQVPHEKQALLFKSEGAGQQQDRHDVPFPTVLIVFNVPYPIGGMLG